MNKRLGAIMIMLVFIFAAIGVVMAESKGNAHKGKYLFRKNCRTCHSENGSAKELSPITKTQTEWEAVFEKIDQVKCAVEWRKLPELDLADIHAHLWGHAFDSPSPAKCK